MALTQEQLEIISDALVPLFNFLEREVIADIARRINSTLTYTRTAELQAMSMYELGYSPAKIRKEAMRILNADADYQKNVAKNTLEYKKEIKELIEDIVKKAKEAGNEIVGNAGNMAWIDDLSVWRSAGKKLTDNSFLHQLVESFSLQTAGEVQNMTRTTGFKGMSGYETLESAYRRELDKAVIKICTGTFSRDKVLKDVVHNLAKSGLRSIDFESGYSMQLDTAARVAIRTGCHQLAGKITDKNMELSGENLVYVSKHWGARNEGTGHANHEQWQGKVYFIREGEDYSEEAQRIGQDRIMDLWYATGYSADGSRENDPLGLYGYNCRHGYHVWFMGVSTLPRETPEPAPITYQGKTYDYYKMTQKMRSMEREIRALKREREAMNSLGMDVTEIKTKIRKKTSEYLRFCEKCKVNPKENRLRYESGSANLKKTKAYKRLNKEMLEKIGKTNYTTPEGADLSGWRPKLLSTSAEQDALLANKNYGRGIGYDDNCQRCVVAYEMRRRGYDVTAKPVIHNGADRIMAGEWVNVFENANWVSCGTGNGLAEIQDLMRRYGDGARAEVVVTWKGNASAHAFVVEQNAGRTVFIDPQDGKRDASDYFNYVADGDTILCRIDNLEPTDLVFDCCEEY